MVPMERMVDQVFLVSRSWPLTISLAVASSVRLDLLDHLDLLGPREIWDHQETQDVLATQADLVHLAR